MASTKLSTTTGLASLRGKGVEIHVGNQPPSDENTWTLPVKLISQHSEYFKAACLWNMASKISLLEQDPIIFGLFVEWIYYETYESITFEPSPSIHAKCWVLADYLLCDELKDYAMCGLFDDHVEKGMLFGSTAISCKDVQYVCSSTAPGSNLRQFYMDFVVDHFADKRMLRGNTAEWDEILQNDPEARLKLLEKMRSPSVTYTKSLEDYQTVNEPQGDSRLRMDVGLAGLSIAEKKTDIATTEHTSNNELSQKTEGSQLSVDAPAFVPAEPLQNAKGEEDADSMDGLNSVVDSGLSPNGSATSDESESERMTK
ncbi:hypothetical protein NW752_012365 [Fusarium irregulare]|uniref:BTB domain-containing protein n=1 Tax=Fusarium irregulare TaxID=2494466 RepID=A0A9W8U6H5_9HYPO|nr:hypothetical protein NW752_012365 [Fusarium irregulare]KAJ4009403.1 hypothetical protein NW766_008520 [Fusarium irregulare]